MKKLFLSKLCIAVMLCVFLTACGKDSDELRKPPGKQPDTNIEQNDNPIQTPVLTETVCPPETPTEVTKPTASPAITAAPEITAVPTITETPVATDENRLFSQVRDSILEQPALSSDGDIKNLTLQLGNTYDELYITWFSKSAAQGHVNFVSESGQELPALVTTRPSRSVPYYYRNQATVIGIEKDTIYHYQVGNDTTVSPSYVYLKEGPHSDNFSFTIASDPEIGLGDLDDFVYDIHSSDWRNSLEQSLINTAGSSFILSLGDHVARKDAPAEYDLFLDQSVLYSIPLMPVVGNHDAVSGFFGDHFSLPNLSAHGIESGEDGDYWFVYGDVLFMVLNNFSTCDDIDHQLFIQETIEQNPDTKWRVLASHYSPVSNVERYQGAAESVDDYFDYAELFDIDLFLGGHDHVYTRSYLMTDDDEFLSTAEEYEFYNPEGAVYVIFSTATSSLYREPDNYPWAAKSIQTNHPQISQATVTENSFTITTYEADTWTVLDTFTIYKD